MGIDAEKCCTKIDKKRDMEDAIGVEMAQADAVVSE